MREHDLAVHGFTDGCPKCTKLRMGHPVSGVFHSTRCRQRIEDALRAAGDRRVEAADRRFAERAAEDMGGEPQPLDPSLDVPVPDVVLPEPARAEAVSASSGPAPAEEALPPSPPDDHMGEDPNPDDDMADAAPDWDVSLRRLAK